MNKIDITDKVKFWKSWEEEELLALKYCPECGFDYGDDDLFISIDENDPYECKNCHTKFIIVQHKTSVFKLENGPIAQQ